ncbi:MAG TPA: PKD domain-containing protein [Tepidisphaeraceae bacterium]|jgi:PKD repeat protein|nr:PKD domain-containing protein [Tepidisphaeraceae bacterium]
MKTFPILALATLLIATPIASAAAWLDGGYAFRRPIDVKWDNDTGRDQMCIADFYTAGHAQPAGADIRVATDDGKAVATHLLQFGPGDHVQICFPLIKDASQYYVYFGNPTKPVPAPTLKTGPDQVPFDAGLLLDMRVFNGGRVRDASDVERAWEQSGPGIGQTIIEQPFLGVNPFGPQVETITKLTGVLVVPADGDYILAAWADRIGSILIDGKPTLFVRLGPGDTRQRTTVHLNKGPHNFVFYNANAGVPGAYSIVWQRPGTDRFQELPKEAFGQVHYGAVGALEEAHKTLTADFTIEYQGECFFADGYSQRYHFIAHSIDNSDAKYEWDFGDGQTFTGQNISHVFVVEGEYPIKLTVRIGGNSDTQTNKLLVTRDWAHLDHPPQDSLDEESNTVARYYNLETMPADWLPRVCWLHEHAGNVDPALAAAGRLAALPNHRDSNEAMRALQDVTRVALSHGKADVVEALWRSVPDSSDLQPRARAQLAQLLLWRSADFDAVVHLLAPYAQGGDAKLRRIYGEALVLDQKPDQGAKELKVIPAAVIGARAPAVSGALARTIEFYIRTGDWESGQDAWEDWQQQFPADFLEGYSVMLQTRLMELKGASPAAAKVAEAFALAEPTSSYAPQLLDRASKLLAKTDPAKSAALHQLLKQKYPEDPLSQ